MQKRLMVTLLLSEISYFTLFLTLLLTAFYARIFYAFQRVVFVNRCVNSLKFYVESADLT